MKGIVFTELMEMVEEKFGMEMLNNIIDESSLSTNGVYSSVGTYEASDLFVMVQKLSQKTGMKIPDLIHAYGRYFFDVLSQNYPIFFEESNCFDFLKTIDSHIHVEVQKLYPDAELPKFSFKEEGNKLYLKYQSERKLSKFALGLIERTIEHYKEDITVLEVANESDGQLVTFELVKKS